MGNFDLNLSLHDFYLSMAVSKVLEASGGQLAFMDGSTMLEDLVSPTAPLLRGYKPDAGVATSSKLILIEAKSFLDMASTHSDKQFKILVDILNTSQQVYLYILVFNAEGRTFESPTLTEIIQTNRVALEYV